MAGAAVGDGVGAPVDERVSHRGVLSSVNGARVQPQDFQGPGGAVDGARGGAECAAQLPHDAGRGQAVADNVANSHRDAVAGQVNQVVPVAAHVQRAGSRPVAHGRPVPPDRARSGQHRLLQAQRDLAGTDELVTSSTQFSSSATRPSEPKTGALIEASVPLDPCPGPAGILLVVALQRHDLGLTGFRYPAQ